MNPTQRLDNSRLAEHLKMVLDGVQPSKQHHQALQAIPGTCTRRSLMTRLQVALTIASLVAAGVVVLGLHALSAGSVPAVSLHPGALVAAAKSTPTAVDPRAKYPVQVVETSEPITLAAARQYANFNLLMLTSAAGASVEGIEKVEEHSAPGSVWQVTWSPRIRITYLTASGGQVQSTEFLREVRGRDVPPH